MNGNDDHSSGGFLGRHNPDSNLRRLMDDVEHVRDRLDEALGSWWDIPYYLLGMVPNGSRRIITELQRSSLQDSCATIHASRVFNDAFGALMCLERGMLVQAHQLLRHCLEATAQAILFLRDPKEAEVWMGGRRFTPGEVRKKLNGKPDFRPLYDELSTVAHANPEARQHHTVPIAPLGFALLFGGTYQPKSVATLVAVLNELLFIYLQAFAAHYYDRLSMELWPLLIDGLRAANADFRAWTGRLPNDWDAMIPHMAQQRLEPIPPPDIDPESLAKAKEAMRKSMLQDQQGDNYR